MEIAKALILADEGRDECPWPAAPAGPRHLFPVANRPILFHQLDALRAAGVLEAAILAGGQAAAATQESVGDGLRFGLRVSYADWQAADGVGGALSATCEFLGDEPVLLQQAGAILREGMRPHIAAFAREELDALALQLPRPAATSSHAITPGCLLSPRAVVMLSRGCNYDPVACVQAEGGRARIERVDGCAPCRGDLETLLEGNRRMLEGLNAAIAPGSLDQCTIQGSVRVHSTARLRRTLVRGPVVIGAGAQISDAYIGPYTAIGAGVVIDGAEIEHSIVLDEAELRFVGTRLESSVIGRGARVTRGFQIPDTLRLSIGDGAEVVVR